MLIIADVFRHIVIFVKISSGAMDLCLIFLSSKHFGCPWNSTFRACEYWVSWGVGRGYLGLAGYFLCRFYQPVEPVFQGTGGGGNRQDIVRVIKEGQGVVDTLVR